MSDSPRAEDATAVRAALEARGYVYLDGQIARDTGEVRMNFVRPGDGTLWINLRDKAPSLLEECCNVYEEVHAVGIGLIHTCTRLRPLGYSEIAKEDLSPELIRDLESEYHYYKAAFWGPRIVVGLAAIVLTGSLETAAHLLGW